MSLINSCVHPISSAQMDVSSSLVYHSNTPDADLTRTISLSATRYFFRPPCCGTAEEPEVTISLCSTFEDGSLCTSKPGPGAIFSPPIGLHEFAGGTFNQTCSGSACPPSPGFTDIRSVFSVTGGCYFADNNGILTISPSLFWTDLLPHRAYGVYFFNLPFLTCDAIECADAVPDCEDVWVVNPGFTWALDARQYGVGAVALVELPTFPGTCGVSWYKACNFQDGDISITSVEQHNISILFSQDGTWISS